MRRELFSYDSLPVRVFWLVVGIILLMQLLAVLPDLSRARHDWLAKQLTEGQLVAASIKAGTDPAMQQDMLRVSQIEAVDVGGGKTNLVQPVGQVMQLPDIHPDDENLLTGMWRTAALALGQGAPDVRIDPSCPPCNQGTGIIVSQRELAQYLQIYATHAAVIATFIALITGCLVYVALDRLLVQPMHIMTNSIVGFRLSPGYSGLGALKWLAARGDDEISRAARELVAMQDELRSALWRNARLAALGTAVVKISHDLRNILTAALLSADRFQQNSDPEVQQATNTLIPALERAVDLVSRTVEFAQEGPPALIRSTVPVRALVDEVADMLRATNGAVTVENLVPETLILRLDRNQIYRVLINLLRNAAEAGATRITVKLEEEPGMAILVVTDDGSGLPGKTVANLFRPFTGAGRTPGLGLTIARDLVRAHGGDVLLRHTGPHGTEFAMSLPGEPEEIYGAAAAE